MSTPRAQTTPTAGYLLAGGSSRRLGRDKALLPWPQQPLLDFMIDLLASVCDPVVVIGAKRETCGANKVTWLSDRLPGLGPVGGISTALQHSMNSSNIIVAIDLPFLTREFLNYFKERCRTSDRLLMACKIESAFPLCIGIRTQLKSAVDAYLASGQRSVHGFVESCAVEVISLAELESSGFTESIFTNINNPTDYEAALKTITRENP